METTFLYMINVAVTMLALAVGYKLLLSSETFFRFNRIIILLSLGLPFVLPFCGLTFHVTAPISTAPISPEGAAKATPASTPLWLLMISAIYIIGVIVMLVRTVMAMVSTWKIIKKGNRTTDEVFGRLVVTERDIAPFNWFNAIVIFRKDYESPDAPIIIAHERAHRDRCHSWDLLFCELVTAVQWFNPAAWLLRFELNKVHEYEADSQAVNACGSRNDYQETLIGRAYAMSAGLMANGFTEQTLKNRIIMLNKKESSRKRVLRALYLLAVIGISMVANAKTVISPASDGHDAVAGSNAQKQVAVAAQQVAPQDKVNKQVKSFSVKPDGTVESHHEGSGEDYQYYLDGKPISDPSTVSPSLVKSMKVMHDGEKMNVYMYTTEQPGAKTVTNIQTSTTFTDNEGNKTIISDFGIKYGYEFYVDGERRESIADIPNDRIESIVVDKSEKEHPKVIVTLKK